MNKKKQIEKEIIQLIINLLQEILVVRNKDGVILNQLIDFYKSTLVAPKIMTDMVDRLDYYIYYLNNEIFIRRKRDKILIKTITKLNEILKISKNL